MTETSAAKFLRRVGIWGLSTAGVLGLWSSIGVADQATKHQERVSEAAGAAASWMADTTEARAPQIVRKVTVLRRHQPPPTAPARAPQPSRRTTRGDARRSTGGSSPRSSGTGAPSRSSGGSSGGTSSSGSTSASSGTSYSAPAPAPVRSSKGS